MLFAVRRLQSSESSTPPHSERNVPAFPKMRLSSSPVVEPAAKRWIPKVPAPGSPSTSPSPAAASLKERILGTHRMRVVKQASAHAEDKSGGVGQEEIVEVLFSSADPLTEAVRRLSDTRRKITSLTTMQTAAIYKGAREIAEVDAIWSLKHGDFYKGKIERERAKALRSFKKSDDDQGTSGDVEASLHRDLHALETQQQSISKEDIDMRQATLARVRAQARSIEIMKREEDKRKYLHIISNELLPIALVLCGRASSDHAKAEARAGGDTSDATENLFDLMADEEDDAVANREVPADRGGGVVRAPSIPLPTARDIAQILTASLLTGHTGGPSGKDVLTPVMKCLKLLMKGREADLVITRVEDSRHTGGPRSDGAFVIKPDRYTNTVKDSPSHSSSASTSKPNRMGSVILGEDGVEVEVEVEESFADGAASPHGGQQGNSDEVGRQRRKYIFQNYGSLFPVPAVVDILYACAFQGVMEEGMLHQLLDWDMRLQRRKLSYNDMLRVVVALGRFDCCESAAMRGMLKDLGSAMQSLGTRKPINSYRTAPEHPLFKFAMAVSPANLFWALATISRCPTRDTRLIHGLADAIILKVRFQERSLRRNCGNVPAAGIAQNALNDVLDANGLPLIGNMSSCSPSAFRTASSTRRSVAVPIESSFGLSLLYEASQVASIDSAIPEAAPMATVFTQDESPLTHLITGRQLQQVDELLKLMEMPYPPLFSTFLQVVGQREGGVMLDHEGADPEDNRPVGHYTIDKDAAREMVGPQRGQHKR